ncbi:hypothetical protein CALVIDRAFT_320938 [Calocera viscosa TUFC12733]|uniref:Uncharacterized protein n=1 Tax=Calocera viscosa (strain TUFC12733) TaxID=1330018 RepID=A0A167QMK0_CALVF|nr:hypothetical protein CALVIDRAFT_320938 [Calocera viscosa TUFC12733]
MSSTNSTLQPVIQQFLQSPQDRVTSAFFLGALLLCSIFFFARAVVHALLGFRLRRNSREASGGSLADRLARLEANEELPRDALRDALARTLGGRAGVVYDAQAYNVRVVLVIIFLGLASISGLVQLVDFPPGYDTACAFFTAFGDICIEAAYVSALYELSVELGSLGVPSRETIPFRILVLVPLILSIASQGLATGSVSALPSPFTVNAGLCARQRCADLVRVLEVNLRVCSFVPISAAIVAVNLAFDIYAFLRLYWTLVPAFLLLRHRAEAMIDVRFAWILSLVVLELLICVPTLTVTSLAAQDIPFALGAILVLVTFTFRPEPEAPPSTASIPGSDAATARSTGRNIETASTGSKYPIDDYGREGYEEYKRRWSGLGNGSKSAPVPKRSSLRQPGRGDKRVSMKAPGEEPPPPPLPPHNVQTAPLGSFPQRSEDKQTETVSAAVKPNPSSRVSINSRSPDAAQRVRSKRYRDTPIVFPTGSQTITQAINAQAGPSVPRPLLLPTMREHAVGGSSKRSPRSSPNRSTKPKLYVYIPPDTSGEGQAQAVGRSMGPSSILAVDDNHRRTPETHPAPEDVVPQDVEVQSRSSDKQSRSSSNSSKRRRSGTALEIVTRTSSGQTQKRISIGNKGEVSIEIRQPQRQARTPRTTSLREHGPQTAATATRTDTGVISPRPRGPRQAPNTVRPGARDHGGPRTAPMLGQLSSERRPEGNWI